MYSCFPREKSFPYFRWKMKGYNKAITLLLVFVFGSKYGSGLSRSKIINVAMQLCPDGESRICPTNSSDLNKQESKTCCLGKQICTSQKN